MQSKVAKIVKKLGLQPHPEGGYFKETYRSTGSIPAEVLGTSFASERNYSTCIYFLLTSDSFSAFHKINQDEIWHFYDGSTIELHSIAENGELKSVLIGKDFSKGEVPQYIVPAGEHFAAKVCGDKSYALVGCTVSPAFDFADFHLAKRDVLTKQFPQHKDLIENFTRA